MHVTVITPPQPIVSWEEAKRHLREDTDDEKVLIESYIAAATAWLDGPAGWLGRSLGVQTLEAVGYLSCSRERLPYGPIIEIVRISTEDAEGGDAINADEDTYRLVDGDLVVLSDATRTTRPVHRIRYRAGYEPAGTEESPISTVPAPIKQAKAGDTVTDTAVAPVNGVSPSISGDDLEVGDVLTANPGVWAPFADFTYQWKRDGANISGATAKTYTLVEADEDKAITVTVTATNVGGAAIATSLPIAIPAGA